MARQRPWSDGDAPAPWHAGADEARTEEATPYRLRRARAEGMVARSAELTAACVLLACVVTAAVTGPVLLARVLELLRWSLSQATTLDVTRDPAIVATALRTLIGLLAPVALVAVLAALAANLLQVGVRFDLRPIVPDPRRIAPEPGRRLARALWSAESGFAVAAAVVKVAAVAAVVALTIRAELATLAGMAGAPLRPALSHLAALAARIAVQVAAVLLAVGMADYLFRRLRHRQALRMSRRELVEERRQLDGDPLVRRRTRERSRALPGSGRWPS